MDAVLYRARGVDVDTVVINGDVVMRGREFTKVSKEEIFKEIAGQLSAELKPSEIERKEVAAEFVPHLQKFYEGWGALEMGGSHQVYNAL